MTTAQLFKIIFISIFLMYGPGMAISGEVGENKTLCTANEDIYFSCELEGGHKVVSICAAGNTSPDNGYVQYRYGEKSRVNFTYPAVHLPPRNIISIIDVSRLAEGIGSHLKFTNDGYRYVISNALVPGEVYVKKNGKIVFDNICNGSDYIPFSNKVAAGVQWGSLEPIDEIDRH